MSNNEIGWSLVAQITRCAEALERLYEAVRPKVEITSEVVVNAPPVPVEAVLTGLSEAALAQRREAGKRSAASRRKRFGSALPNGAPNGPNGTAERTERKSRTDRTELPNGDRTETSPRSNGPNGAPNGTPNGAKRSKPKLPDGASVPVWEAYAASFRNRWGIAPPRNHRANSFCCDLIRLLGLEDAVAVAGYYPTSPSRFHVEQKHPLNLLIQNPTKFVTEMKTGIRTSRDTAAREERVADAKDTFKDYISQEESRGSKAPF